MFFLLDFQTLEPAKPGEQLKAMAFQTCSLAAFGRSAQTVYKPCNHPVPIKE